MKMPITREQSAAAEGFTSPVALCGRKWWVRELPLFGWFQNSTLIDVEPAPDDHRPVDNGGANDAL